MAGVYLERRGNSERDRPLTFHWHLREAVPPGLSRGRDAAYEAVRASILAEAILGWQQSKAVSYSRRESFYSGFGRYHGTEYTYRNVLAVVEELSEVDLIHNNQVPPGNLGCQSSFTATDRLIDWNVSVSVGMVYTSGEIIRLKDRHKKLMAYVDTDLTRKMRRELAAINEGLAAIQITVPAAQWDGPHMKFGESTYVLPTPGNDLHRVFNRCRWSFGGRVYGWFQNLPKTARRTMLLAGESTAEIDLDNLHIRMCYHEAGMRLGDADLYAIDGIERKAAKLALLIGINAPSEKSAVYALALELKVGRREAARILEAVKAHHKPIAGRFGSDAGTHLMRRDSEIMLGAIKALTRRGYPALPIHDSIVVPAHVAQLAAELMTESYERQMGSGNTCPVTING